MLSSSEAREILDFKLPDMDVRGNPADFNGLWVFCAYWPIGEDEREMNPFVSVDKNTGDVCDFSPIGSGDLPSFFQRLSDANPGGVS